MACIVPSAVGGSVWGRRRFLKTTKSFSDFCGCCTKQPSTATKAGPRLFLTMRLLAVSRGGGFWLGQSAGSLGLGRKHPDHAGGTSRMANLGRPISGHSRRRRRAARKVPIARCGISPLYLYADRGRRTSRTQIALMLLSMHGDQIWTLAGASQCVAHARDVLPPVSSSEGMVWRLGGLPSLGTSVKRPGGTPS
jgi:hypothetical protein